jgi:hypothetical protein
MVGRESTATMWRRPINPPKLRCYITRGPRVRALRMSICGVCAANASCCFLVSLCAQSARLQHWSLLSCSHASCSVERSNQPKGLEVSATSEVGARAVLGVFMHKV